MISGKLNLLKVVLFFFSIILLSNFSNPFHSIGLNHMDFNFNKLKLAAFAYASTSCYVESSFKGTELA